MRLGSQNLAIWYLRERRGETLSHYLHYPVTLGCLPCTWKSNAPFLRLHIAATSFLAEEGWMWLPSKSINVTSLINLEGHHCTSIKKGWVQFSLSPDCGGLMLQWVLEKVFSGPYLSTSSIPRLFVRV